MVSSENQSQVIVDSSNTMTYREVCLAIEKVLKNEELMEKYMMSPGLKGKTFIIQVKNIFKYNFFNSYYFDKTFYI